MLRIWDPLLIWMSLRTLCSLRGAIFSFNIIFRCWWLSLYSGLSPLAGNQPLVYFSRGRSTVCSVAIVHCAEVNCTQKKSVALIGFQLDGDRKSSLSVQILRLKGGPRGGSLDGQIPSLQPHAQAGGRAALGTGPRNPRTADSNPPGGGRVNFIYYL